MIRLLDIAPRKYLKVPRLPKDRDDVVPELLPRLVAWILTTRLILAQHAQQSPLNALSLQRLRVLPGGAAQHASLIRHFEKFVRVRLRVYAHSAHRVNGIRRLAPIPIREISHGALDGPPQLGAEHVPEIPSWHRSSFPRMSLRYSPSMAQLMPHFKVPFVYLFGSISTRYEIRTRFPCSRNKGPNP